jgi:hypothetical protein
VEAVKERVIESVKEAIERFSLLLLILKMNSEQQLERQGKGGRMLS